MSPTLPINGFILIDSEQRSKHQPDTWAHPDHETLERIEPGYFVKVGVTHPELDGERFWELFKERIGPDIVIQVDQDMVHSKEHGLCDKDTLIVEEQNVFGIVDARGVTVWEAK
jgi:hypothetical protein